MGKRKFIHKPVGKNILTRFLRLVEEQGFEGIGKYYGTYPAIVYSTDDPEKLDRIQVIIPQISGDLALDSWFIPRGNFAGKDYGLHLLPKEGDLVNISFPIGDVSGYGHWEHGHWAKDEKPTDEELSEDGIWFKTPSGHLVSFNNTTDAIYIKHKEGPTVKLSKDGISLITKKNISLGQDNSSDEPAVLGDKNEEALKTLADGIIGIVDAFTNSTVVTDNSGAGLKASLTGLTTSIKVQMESFKQSVKNTKSKKVSLD